VKALVPESAGLEVAFPAAMLSEVGTKESWRKEVHLASTGTTLDGAVVTKVDTLATQTIATLFGQHSESLFCG
jgi:hypothetical protein